jgi:hypothetical protein
MLKSLKHREARRKHIPTTELEGLVAAEDDPLEAQHPCATGSSAPIVMTPGGSLRSASATSSTLGARAPARVYS